MTGGGTVDRTKVGGSDRATARGFLLERRQHQGEQAVVWSHKASVRRFQQDSRTFRAHAGIYYRQVDGVWWEDIMRNAQDECARKHILRGDLMRDVHKRKLGIDA